ncbi:uncharacterized protein CDAR_518961 [Caerostris darwini]|uniref:Transposase n=1 Tax=Caerostris darwini TaxID=1538125 RepID=A0AAV4PTA2_9ARAC|nr:uncharacterized protein CDAR_518961 [Caerostris darwini]
MWYFLSKDDYGTLLNRLIENRDKCGYKYQEIFGKYWLQSPASFKECTIKKEWNSAGVLSELFKFEDVENIKLILRDTSAFDKERLIRSNTGVRMCHKFIIHDQWHLLRLYIQECVLSSEAVVKLKQDYEEFLKFYGLVQDKWRKPKWDNFYQILDDTRMVIIKNGECSTMQVDESKAKYNNKRKSVNRITMKKRRTSQPAVKINYLNVKSRFAFVLIDLKKTIDHKKTAELLVRGHEPDIDERYSYLFNSVCYQTKAVGSLKQDFEELMNTQYRIGQIKERQRKWDRFYPILEDSRMKRVRDD